jgi:hypothetical protein
MVRKIGFGAAVLLLLATGLLLPPRTAVRTCQREAVRLGIPADGARADRRWSGRLGEGQTHTVKGTLAGRPAYICRTITWEGVTQVDAFQLPE